MKPTISLFLLAISLAHAELPTAELPPVETSKVDVTGATQVVRQTVGPLARLGLAPTPAKVPMPTTANVVTLTGPALDVGGNPGPSVVEVTTVDPVSTKAIAKVVPVNPQAPVAAKQPEQLRRPVEVAQGEVILPVGDMDFQNAVRVGDIVPSEREQLYRRTDISVDYNEEPSDVVISDLAAAAKINIMMGKLDPKPITLRASGNPFRLLERVISGYGYGLVRTQDGMFIVTEVDRKNLIQKRYTFKHIILNRDFSFRDSSIGSGNNSGPQTAQNSQSNYGSQPLGSNSSGSYEKVTNRTSSEPPRSPASREVQNTILERIKSYVYGKPLNPSGDNVLVTEKANDRQFQEDKSIPPPIYDADSNSLLVVTTEERWRWIQDFLETADVEQFNIQLTIRIVAQNKSDGRQMGVNWAGGSRNGLGNGVPFSATGVQSTTTTTADDVTTGLINLGSIGTKAILSMGELEAQLHFFASNADSRVETKAPMTTLNNREIIVNFTKNYPVILPTSQSSSFAGGATEAQGFNVSNEDIGTVARFLGQQVRGDLINLSIGLDVSNVDATITLGSTKTEFPIITKSHTDTSIQVRAGATVVLGGLEQIVTSKTISKVPILGDMPLFGFAFKDLVKNNQLSSLSMYITVELVDSNGKIVRFPKEKI